VVIGACFDYFWNIFGSYYPIKNLKLSILIDAMVNILDDFFDEQMDKETKSLFILEYLRVFSTYSKTIDDPILEDLIASYFNKLITLAVAESLYMEKVKKESDLKKVVEYSKILLTLRGMDIDIFVEIATLNNKRLKNNQDLMKLARSFRAINIFKKDIGDIDYDRKQGQETLVTFMYSKDKEKLNSYVDLVLSELRKSSEAFLEKLISSKNDESRFIGNSFNNQMLENTKEAKNLIVNL